MGHVAQARKRARLRDSIHIERLARLLQDFDQLLVREPVPDAQIREALNFRKRAQDHDVPPLAYVFERVGRVIKELVVRLVENDGNVLRHSLHERVDLRLAYDRAGRVVWVRDEELARARRDRGGHRRQVMGKIWVVDLDGLRAEERGHQRVHNERVLRGDDFVARPQERVPDELDDLVRTVAEDHVLHLEPVLLRDRVAQVIAAAIRVEMRALERLVHRAKRRG